MQDTTPKASPSKIKKQKKSKNAELSSSSSRSNLKPISSRSNNSLLGVPNSGDEDETPEE